MAFDGFPKDTLAYLRELEKNNTKAFFDANRKRYEEVWVEPAQQLVVTLGPKLQKLVPTIEFAPHIRGSLMRQNRDVRFAKDKSPYKTHLDLFFWDGEVKSFERPGFFFRLTTTQLMCGVGVHSFEKDALAKYRAAVDDETQGAALAKLVTKLRKIDGLVVGRQDYKNVPKGFDAEHPRADLLRHGALYAAFETPIPSELTTPGFVDVVFSRMKTATPLRDWLATALAA